MAKQHTKPDSPAHTAGVHKGEEWTRSHKEPGRENATATARSATGINAKSRAPIDPRMPNLPPA